MKYKNILFDLDGTLVKSERGIFNSIRHALKEDSLENISDEDLLPFIGPPLIDSFQKQFGFDEEKAMEIVNKYRAHYTKIGLFENEIYEGIGDLLLELHKNCRLFVVTTKPQPFAEKILDHYNFKKLFDRIYGPSFDGKYNDKKELMKFALEESNLNPSECLMIGDRFYDMEAAKVNDVDALGVLYGYGDEEELLENGAKDLVSTAEEILKYIKNKK
ncbi:MAG: HAD hydrolase-like protein [Gallicola sp.]|nr:HAD hydrolase-like protein [Gallicola sp.]